MRAWGHLEVVVGGRSRHSARLTPRESSRGSSREKSASWKGGRNAGSVMRVVGRNEHEHLVVTLYCHGVHRRHAVSRCDGSDERPAGGQVGNDARQFRASFASIHKDLSVSHFAAVFAAYSHSKTSVTRPQNAERQCEGPQHDERDARDPQAAGPWPPSRRGSLFFLDHRGKRDRQVGTSGGKPSVERIGLDSSFWWSIRAVCSSHRSARRMRRWRQREVATPSGCGRGRRARRCGGERLSHGETHMQKLMLLPTGVHVPPLTQSPCEQQYRAQVP